MDQKKLVGFFILLAVIVMAIIAFIIYRFIINPAKPVEKSAVVLPTFSSAVGLTVQTAPATPLNKVGQVILYSYAIKNIGAAPIPGTISVTGAVVTCPNANTIGNLDNALDANETVTCASSHPITQADLDVGSVTSVNSANVNGILSAPVTTKVVLVQTRLLTLTKTANPQTFDHVGQTITYTYVITNSGNVTLGPAQFIVTDPGLAAPLNCGAADTKLAPAAKLTCTGTHVITQADLNAGSVATSATVSGGGSQASAPASATITKSSLAPTPTPIPQPVNPSNLTAGTNIQHKVAVGEWLWQIARCYGTDPKQTVQANPQLPDPDLISPDTIVSVPNIGSKGTIYGPACVTAYTVQSGDTWLSIGQKYDASTEVLMRANPGSLLAGRVLVVPLHSNAASQ